MKEGTRVADKNLSMRLSGDFARPVAPVQDLLVAGRLSDCCLVSTGFIPSTVANSSAHLKPLAFPNRLGLRRICVIDAKRTQGIFAVTSDIHWSAGGS